jgi:D-3-phosphoglycerate dehydrogenase
MTDQSLSPSTRNAAAPARAGRLPTAPDRGQLLRSEGIRVVATEPLPFGQAVVDALLDLGATLPEDRIPPERLEDLVHEVDVVITDRVALPTAVLDAATRLKYVVIPAAQADWFDAHRAANRGVTLVTCPDYAGNAVAEHAIGSLLSLARHFAEAVDSLRAGIWSSGALRGVELRGRRMVVIGRGRVGARVAELGEAIGMRVATFGASATAPEIDELLVDVDALVLALPSTPSTVGILDRRRLRMLKDDAFIVNVGRGDAIDEAALVAQLDEGRLGGVALDVFIGEPLLGSPDERIVRLAQHPRVLATPHIAYDTAESNARLGAELVNAVQGCMTRVAEGLRAGVRDVTSCR